MTPAAFRRWTVGLWLPLALSAAVIALLRLGAVLDNGPANNTTSCEDISIWNIHALTRGEPAYVDCFSYPYRTSLFNWLFYRTYGAAAWLAGPAPAQLPTLLRLVTFAFVLLGLAASAWFLAQFAGGLGSAGGLLVGSIAVLTWFGPVICWWPWTVRPDLPAIVLEFLAFILVARGQAAGRLLAAGLLFFLAWSFKQNEAAILAGTVLALLLQREWRAALLLGTVFALLAASVLLSADEAYWSNAVRGPTVAGWSLVAIWQKAAGWLFLGGSYLLAPAILLAYVLPPAERRAFLQQRAVRLTAVVFATALVLNLLGSGRSWSARNYYYESWAIGMTFTGLATLHAVRSFTGFPAPAARNLWIATTVCLLLAGAAYTAVVFVPLDKPYTRTGENLELAVRLPRPPFAAELVAAVRSSPAPFLCDDPLLQLHAAHPEASHAPVIEYTIYLDALRGGLIRDEDIAARIRQRWYAVLWLEAEGTIWEPLARSAGYVPGRVTGHLRPWRRPA